MLTQQTQTKLFIALILIVNLITSTAFGQMFTDVAHDQGIDQSGPCGLVYWYDYDGDNDLDLLRTARFGGSSNLYRNEGGGFTRLNDIGLPTNWDGGRAIPMDFDHDGDLDLMMGSYGNYMLIFAYDNGRYWEVREDLGIPQLGGQRDIDWVDFDRDGWMDILIQSLYGWTFLKNEDGTHFADETPATGLPDDDGNGFCLADVDFDGDVDMFAARLGNLGKYWENLGENNFADQSAHVGLSGIPSYSGCLWADFNNDKYPDLLTRGGNYHGIWLNRGNGTFRQAIVHGTDTDFSQWPGGAMYSVGDFNMDGKMDVYCVRAGGCGATPSPNQLFVMDSLAEDEFWFTDQAPALGMNIYEDGFSRAADYDGDGDLDIFLASHNGPNRLFRNNTNSSATRLEVEILGPNGEIDRWQSRVDVYEHGTDILVKSGLLNFSSSNISGFNHYFVLDGASSYDIEVTFGTGDVMTPALFPELSGIIPDEVDYFLSVRLDEAVSADEPNAIVPQGLQLNSIYPNPFNSSLEINFTTGVLPTSLKIYDLTGQLVADLARTSQLSSERVVWDASNQPTGVYFVRLSDANLESVQKVFLLK